MLLNQLFEAAKANAAFCFGRFNPAHQGHVAVWNTVASSGVQWFVGTNPGTSGANDPLPISVKTAWMEAIDPKLKGHIVSTTSVMTLAAEIYKQVGENATVVYVTDDKDWAWSGKLLNDYNGKEATHGYYKFAKIVHVPSPRVTSATELRDAARAGNEEQFYKLAGVSPSLKVNGKSYFETVAEFCAANPVKVKKVKKVAEPKQEPAAPQGEPEMAETVDTYSVKTDAGQEFPCNDQDHAVNKARSLLSYKKADKVYILKNGKAVYSWQLNSKLEPIAETKQRLDPKCWKGYRKVGTKIKGGVKVNKCVKIGEAWESEIDNLVKLLESKVDEKWSQKYKKSINCSNPKGFSQKAHCAGKKKNENFADGKGPGRPGDSQRHGIPKKATKAELEKASHAKGRKGQLARWQLNMRNGKKK